MRCLILLRRSLQTTYINAKADNSWDRIGIDVNGMYSNGKPSTLRTTLEKLFHSDIDPPRPMLKMIGLTPARRKALHIKIIFLVAAGLSVDIPRSERVKSSKALHMKTTLFVIEAEIA
ncbi:hypothetical protein [Polynucleobacter sp. AP-Sving-400A-A2]|uniref:hypothetical protein n=1 Tax=Polynucleobacter sp. AP-Sving-400A-A2 TaxID=2081049 RepID=UPI00203EA5A8|nr:hypothetical protein [Polynucleobacter sp. AP-Sving-400A-A2]